MRLFCLGLLVFVAACAARSANPVPLSQPGDDRLNCQQIADEFDRNRASILVLIDADQDVVNGNVAKAVLWPFILDLSQVEQIQARALIDRNERLTRLAAARDCPTPG